jgi:hypothetical protein
MKVRVPWSGHWSMLRGDGGGVPLGHKSIQRPEPGAPYLDHNPPDKVREFLKKIAESQHERDCDLLGQRCNASGQSVWHSKWQRL